MQRRHLLALAALPLLAEARRATTVRTRVDTPLGPFVVEVDTGVAPITVANYLAYVDHHLLDKAWVYRLVSRANQPQSAHMIEVVQWGLNLPDEARPPRPPIAHESTRQTGLRHRDGTVSMARGAPGTAAAEFFICIGDQPKLDYGGHRNPDGQGFAAFGRVVQGMEVVRALHARAGEDQWLKAPIAIGPVHRI
ncbi:peptidylprolyl isomerase [Roseateles saccharophilus]|uniref:peptidylprolyl isomerase n=1 Tax=Roseateles saccharophilus TaxID=304 RepID=A0A4R3V4W5_ROSSA|nr:peptidylprolyl isomerase [Roseateles saccharophilus]MDG0831979.1 peptidylprolyl isomerase [Roseateles saccharophilus]TCU97354.1 peptidyl-prolyl cis-trans isomerase A (cyclophilin A) [Roseateles saccharophilus]